MRLFNRFLRLWRRPGVGSDGARNIARDDDLPQTKAWACSHFHVGVSREGREIKADGSNSRVLSLRLLFQACGCCKCPIVSLRLLQAINMEAFSAGGIAASRTAVRRRYSVPHSTGLAKCFQAANAPSPTAPPDEVINMPLPQSVPVGIFLEPFSNWFMFVINSDPLARLSTTCPPTVRSRISASAIHPRRLLTEGLPRPRPSALLPELIYPRIRSRSGALSGLHTSSPPTSTYTPPMHPVTNSAL